MLIPRFFINDLLCFLCPERDLNPHGAYAPSDFKSDASADFAIWAGTHLRPITTAQTLRLLLVLPAHPLAQVRLLRPRAEPQQELLAAELVRLPELLGLLQQELLPVAVLAHRSSIAF